jgi:hypothetical protein
MTPDLPVPLLEELLPHEQTVGAHAFIARERMNECELVILRD